MAGNEAAKQQGWRLSSQVPASHCTTPIPTPPQNNQKPPTLEGSLLLMEVLPQEPQPSVREGFR